MIHIDDKELQVRQKTNRISMYILISIFIVFSVLLGVILDLVIGTKVLFTILFSLFSLTQLLFGLSITGSFIVRIIDAKKLDDDNLNRILEEIKEETQYRSDIALFAIKSPSINALTFGRSEHGHKLCITTGAIEKLQYDELKAILAHEVFHIISKDTDYLTTVSGTFGSPMLLFKLSTAAIEKVVENKGKISPREFYKELGLFSSIAIATIFLLPISILTNVFVSVRKEFDADVFAAVKTSNESVVKLLLKTRENCKSLGTNYFFMRHLFFADPSCKDTFRKTNKIFDAYPTIEERISFIEGINSKK
ncbi:MAG: M48 family metallopeptidase [Fervidobacterium sp.]|jgi:heat shock protein HtpX